ncbi:MAG TPA: hypothetical protein VER55_14960 [Ardenticatenaceae bacterium]|nr:hypothetical protein [Ardenticatenaceae bacterium]
MRHWAVLDPWERGELSNRRRANCRVCGTLVPKGEGIRWSRKHGYHLIVFYLCPACDREVHAEVAASGEVSLHTGITA